MNKWKLSATVLAFLYCLNYLTTLTDWHFIDNINLVVHEAGHAVFMPFGYFLTIAGGTILQLLIPAVFTAYFVFKNQYHSASLLLYWIALNLFNVSVYAGDALTMKLPLLTGDVDTHDWNQLLFTLGWLKHTDFISHTILGAGMLLLIIALVWGIYESRRTIQEGVIS